MHRNNEELSGVPGSRRVTSAREIAGGWYVYVYVEKPVSNALGQWVDGQPLYVGKGVDARAFAGHRWAARRVNRGKKANSAWLYKFAQMLRDGTEFAVFVLFEKLSEAEAYAHEKVLIEAIGRRNAGTGPLYNLVDGGEGLTSERARAMSSSPAFKVAMKKLHADPVYRATNRAHLTKLAADPRQQELRRRWAAEQQAKRRKAREALTEEAKQELLSRKRAEGRAQWEARKARANQARREKWALRQRETKQEVLRKTLEGKLERNAADRARRRRKRAIALGITSPEVE